MALGGACIAVVLTTCLAIGAARPAPTRSAAARTDTKPSRASPRAVMLKVYTALQRYSGDGVPRSTRPIRYRYKGRWRDARRVYLNSAELDSSGGKYRADCDDTNPTRLKYFEIRPYGMGFETCGPRAMYKTQSKVGEFRSSVDEIGDYVMDTTGMSETGQLTGGVKATRRTARATYECRPRDRVAGQVTNDWVSSITITSTRRATRARIVYCLRP